MRLPSPVKVVEDVKERSLIHICLRPVVSIADSAASRTGSNAALHYGADVNTAAQYAQESSFLCFHSVHRQRCNVTVVFTLTLMETHKVI